MRVLIADKLAPSVQERLRAAGCEVHQDPQLKTEALTAAIAERDPHVLVVRSTKVKAEQLDAASSLKLIIRGGAGYNTIDIERAGSQGVSVANCPGKNAMAVAELTIGQLVNLDRRIADNVAALRQHVWAKKEFGKARGLYGRTLAVLGTGRIGREVIKRALAFGMKIRAWDIALTPEWAEQLGVEYCATPQDACRDADALTAHVAMNEATRHLINAELLGLLAPGAYVINTTRGGVVDQAALLQAIEERGLRAGLDVYADEPAATDNVFPHAIADNPNVYGTHHIGASTEQAADAVGDEVVRIVLSWLDDGSVLNLVNAEHLSA